MNLEKVGGLRLCQFCGSGIVLNGDKVLVPGQTALQDFLSCFLQLHVSVQWSQKSKIFLKMF